MGSKHEIFTIDRSEEKEEITKKINKEEERQEEGDKRQKKGEMISKLSLNEYIIYLYIRIHISAIGTHHSDMESFDITEYLGHTGNCDATYEHSIIDEVEVDNLPNFGLRKGKRLLFTESELTKS